LFIEVSNARHPKKVDRLLHTAVVTIVTNNLHFLFIELIYITTTRITMKFQSDAQTTRTSPTALSSSNSILQALSNGSVVDTSVLPPVPVSAEVRRERLRMILASAIAVIESCSSDPIESSKTQPPQPPQ
jgi:hypothetical protein